MPLIKAEVTIEEKKRYEELAKYRRTTMSGIIRYALDRQITTTTALKNRDLEKKVEDLKRELESLGEKLEEYILFNT